MATGTHFQLFPPPTSKARSNIEELTRPIRNFSLKNMIADDQVKSPAAESVIIQIIEEPSRQGTPAHMKDHAAQDRSSSPVFEQEAVPAPPAHGHRVFPIDTNPTPKSTMAEPVSAVSARSATLAQSPVSPGQPMRSMFPTYNPSVRLSQQQYYPQRLPGAQISGLQRQNTTRQDYSPSITPSPLDQTLGPKTVPASVLNFPSDVLDLREPRFSTVAELEKLWDATNGQGPEPVIGDFDLQMARTAEALFSFGSTPTQPFYTLETFDNHELSISRTHPRKPTKNIPVLLLPLEDPARRLPPNDGLITYIFPKLAAMLAIDQSVALAEKHQLAPSERDEMQSEAVARAAAQEACHLVWNETCKRYELLHPALGKDPRAPDYTTSPTLRSGKEEAALHITVSSHSYGSQSSISVECPVILVTDPNSSPDHESVPAELRMSTVPVSDTDEPLASLDFATMTLHISASQILNVAPSLYAVDSIVSAMLAVAVTDSTTNAIMAAMDLWTPRSTPKGPASVFGGSVGGKSYTGSVLYATIAEREEAEDEAKLMKQMHREDTGRSRSGSRGSFWGRKSSTTSKKKGVKQVQIAEFDLEKYGQYQAGSREGQKLPGVVRGGLEVMFMALNMIVWGLTLLVQFVAWLMVNVTRCVTSEKF